MSAYSFEQARKAVVEELKKIGSLSITHITESDDAWHYSIEPQAHFLTPPKRPLIGAVRITYEVNRHSGKIREIIEDPILSESTKTVRLPKEQMDRLVANHHLKEKRIRRLSKFHSKASHLAVNNDRLVFTQKLRKVVSIPFSEISRISLCSVKIFHEMFDFFLVIELDNHEAVYIPVRSKHFFDAWGEIAMKLRIDLRLPIHAVKTFRYDLLYEKSGASDTWIIPQNIILCPWEHWPLLGYVLHYPSQLVRIYV